MRLQSPISLTSNDLTRPVKCPPSGQVPAPRVHFIAVMLAEPAFYMTGDGLLVMLAQFPDQSNSTGIVSR